MLVMVPSKTIIFFKQEKKESSNDKHGDHQIKKYFKTPKISRAIKEIDES